MNHNFQLHDLNDKNNIRDEKIIPPLLPEETSEKISAGTVGPYDAEAWTKQSSLGDGEMLLRKEYETILDIFNKDEKQKEEKENNATADSKKASDQSCENENPIQ